MTMRVPRVLCCVLGLAMGFAAVGCESTAVSKDAKTSFLNADDLVSMTDQMAQSILADPRVQAETAKGPLIIVMKPIVNSTNEIIVGNRKELYVHRLRTLLSTRPELRDRFMFVLNKADYDKLQREEGLSDTALGPREERVMPQFVLWGEFYADTEARSKTRSDIYLCTYKLTRLSGGDILWEHSYETHKSVNKTLLD